MRFRTKAA